jgi:hypothetical protein
MNTPKRQTVFRQLPENARFTTIPQETIQDKSLTLAETGMLVWLLSLPPTWRANSRSLADWKQSGEHAIRTAMRGLKEKGYLKRQIDRGPNGRVTGSVWLISNVVKPEWIKTATEVQVFRTSVDPTVGGLATEYHDTGSDSIKKQEMTQSIQALFRQTRDAITSRIEIEEQDNF